LPPIRAFEEGLSRVYTRSSQGVMRKIDANGTKTTTIIAMEEVETRQISRRNPSLVLTKVKSK